MQMQALPTIEPGSSSSGMKDSLAVATRALEAVRAATAQFELFGSFLLGSDEFALSAASIQEVVQVPAKLIPVPLSPAYVEGVFTLRGTVVPVLNLARIFDPAALPAASHQKIVIVDHQHVLLGLLIDTLGEVLRVRPEQRSVMQYQPGSSRAVISGTILLDEGARLLQILDADALVQIENLPQVRALQASTRMDKSRFHQQAGRRKCISFTVRDVAFAFEMAAIREIITVPEIQPSIMAGGMCLGRIDFRGQPVAVVDFAALMQFGARGAADPARNRILVAPIGGSLIGFLVDSVNSILSYLDSELMPVPLLSRARAGMIAGCLSRPDEGDILCLNHEGVLSHAELLELSEGHINLYRKDAGGEARERKASGPRVAHVTFSLDAPWAVEMRQLREIIAHRPGMMRPPGLPAWVHGVLNLRQRAVTVIDLRALLGLPAAVPSEHTRILIVEDGEDLYGCMVDSVDSIVQVGAGQRRATSRMLEQSRASAQVIDAIDGEGNVSTMSVLDVAAFLKLIAT